jgi:hypothetical protein
LNVKLFLITWCSSLCCWMLIFQIFIRYSELFYLKAWNHNISCENFENI